MKTIRTNDIARVIATRYDIELREAIAFVGAMIDVLNDALHYEKQVKVKGLGTFKVTTVSSRESIDVTTGERISIESRDKITFTPDATLRDRVNAPFAQFETVIVNDGVDFSEIDARYQAETETDSADAEEMVPKPAAVVALNLENTNSEHSGEAVVEDATENPILLEDATQNPVSDGDGETGEKTLMVSEEKQGAEGGEDREEETVVSEGTSHEELNLLRQQLAELMEQRTEVHNALRRSRRMFRWLVACFILLLFVCGGIVYYYNGQSFGQNFVAIDGGQNETAVVVPSDTLQADTATVSADSLSAVAQDESEAMDVQGEEEAVNYDADPRIRLGAYRIVGIDRTVTVLRGQTFKMISRAHLGDGMECYMEAVNPGVTTLKEGDILNIPKLELKRKGR